MFVCEICIFSQNFNVHVRQFVEILSPVQINGCIVVIETVLGNTFIHILAES